MLHMLGTQTCMSCTKAGATGDCQLAADIGIMSDFVLLLTSMISNVHHHAYALVPCSCPMLFSHALVPKCFSLKIAAVALLLQEAFTDPQFVFGTTTYYGFVDQYTLANHEAGNNENADKCANVSVLL